MPLIYFGWQCLMGTLHGNETVNPQVKQIQPFVITYTTILEKKQKKKKLDIFLPLLVLFQFEVPTSIYMKQEAGNEMYYKT